jgi:ribosome biogenesis ATPase
VLTRPLRLAGEVDFAAVAARTPGFVGADLAALAKEAAALAVRRIFEQLEQARPRGCDRGRVPAQLLEHAAPVADTSSARVRAGMAAAVGAPPHAVAAPLAATRRALSSSFAGSGLPRVARGLRPTASL